MARVSELHLLKNFDSLKGWNYRLLNRFIIWCMKQIAFVITGTNTIDLFSSDQLMNESSLHLNLSLTSCIHSGVWRLANCVKCFNYLFVIASTTDLVILFPLIVDLNGQKRSKCKRHAHFYSWGAVHPLPSYHFEGISSLFYSRDPVTPRPPWPPTFREITLCSFCSISVMRSGGMWDHLFLVRRSRRFCLDTHARRVAGQHAH